MTGLISIAAVVLACVLTWAAVLKVLDHDSTVEGFALLGLPRPGQTAWIVPAFELAIAVALLLTPGWGGVAAFVMLSGFTTFLVTMIRSGVSVPCRCFGASGEAAVSKRDVARNVVLLVVAGLSATLDKLVTPSITDLLAGAVVMGGVAAGFSVLGRQRVA